MEPATGIKTLQQHSCCCIVIDSRLLVLRVAQCRGCLCQGVACSLSWFGALAAVPFCKLAWKQQWL